MELGVNPVGARRGAGVATTYQAEQKYLNSLAFTSALPPSPGLGPHWSAWVSSDLERCWIRASEEGASQPEHLAVCMWTDREVVCPLPAHKRGVYMACCARQRAGQEHQPLSQTVAYCLCDCGKVT